MTADVIVERVDHDCRPPGILPIPDGARFVIARWRCPTCGQKWRIKSWAASSVAERYGRHRSLPATPKWLRESADSGSDARASGSTSTEPPKGDTE